MVSLGPSVMHDVMHGVLSNVIRGLDVRACAAESVMYEQTSGVIHVVTPSPNGGQVNVQMRWQIH